MWTLDFRTRDVGGPVATTPLLYEDDVWRGHGLSALPLLPGGTTFVIHGFNNDREEGRAGVGGFIEAAVNAVPSLADTRFVGVLWPGDAIFKFLSYPTEEADADDTAYELARTLLAARLPGEVNLIAHSLGTRVALQTVTTLVGWDKTYPWVDQMVLMAAAVDADCLARSDRYRKGVKHVTRLVNVASTADDVLRFAFPVGDWLAGIFTGGYTRTALGRNGPAESPVAPKHVRSFQVGHLGIDHGEYLGGDTPERRRASKFGGNVIERNEPLAY